MFVLCINLLICFVLNYLPLNYIVLSHILPYCITEWQAMCIVFCVSVLITFFYCNMLYCLTSYYIQTWNLSKILHRQIFRLKFLHRQFHLISTVLVRKNTKNEGKWRNLHRWQQILHSRRDWRDGQISPLLRPNGLIMNIFNFATENLK